MSEDQSSEDGLGPPARCCGSQIALTKPSGCWEALLLISTSRPFPLQQQYKRISVRFFKMEYRIRSNFPRLIIS
jgi:hypothetical protein